MIDLNEVYDTLRNNSKHTNFISRPITKQELINCMDKYSLWVSTMNSYGENGSCYQDEDMVKKGRDNCKFVKMFMLDIFKMNREILQKQEYCIEQNEKGLSHTLAYRTFIHKDNKSTQIFIYTKDICGNNYWFCFYE